MEFLIDFQAFKDNYNGYIIKELAIVTVDEQVFHLSLFKPPFKFYKLSLDKQKTNSWLHKYYHGLDWNYGYEEYTKLTQVLKTSVQPRSTVYVKGITKQQFLHTLLSDHELHIVNMEDLGCPSLTKLKDGKNTFFLRACQYDHSKRNCAYINVVLLLNWLKSNRCITETLESVNTAMEKYFKGITDSSVVQLLPKSFLMNHLDTYSFKNVYDKLPSALQMDPSLRSRLPCDSHYEWRKNSTTDFEGPNPERRYCVLCKLETTYV